jgi:dipeptide/tripeptide permease
MRPFTLLLLALQLLSLRVLSQVSRFAGGAVGSVFVHAAGVPAEELAAAARTACAIALGKGVAKDVGGSDPELGAPPQCAAYLQAAFAGVPGVSVSVEDDAAQIAAVLAFAFRKSDESRRIAAILVLFIAAQIFWAIFEQAGSSISLFADRLTDNRLFGHAFPSAWWQSINSAWVIVLAAPFAWLWIKLGAKQPSSPAKFALGLFFVGLSFVWMIPAAKLTAEGKVGPIWLLGLFFFQTVGEMCLSPVGLSTMTKLAPARLLGLVMGIWFLAAALGNKLAGVLAGEFNSTDSAALADFFLKQALLVGGATAVLFALVPWVKRLMGGVR